MIKSSQSLRGKNLRVSLRVTPRGTTDMLSQTAAGTVYPFTHPLAHLFTHKALPEQLPDPRLCAGYWRIQNGQNQTRFLPLQSSQARRGINMVITRQSYSFHRSSQEKTPCEGKFLGAFVLIEAVRGFLTRGSG